MVLIKVMPGVTSWAMSLSPVLIRTGRPALSASRAGANHIVSFDARDSHQRQPHRFHHLMQRLNLRAQIVRHRRAVRFVMLEQFITEGFPFASKTTTA